MLRVLGLRNVNGYDALYPYNPFVLTFHFLFFISCLISLFSLFLVTSNFLLYIFPSSSLLPFPSFPTYFSFPSLYLPYNSSLFPFPSFLISHFLLYIFSSSSFSLSLLSSLIFFSLYISFLSPVVTFVYLSSVFKLALTHLTAADMSTLTYFDQPDLHKPHRTLEVCAAFSPRQRAR